MPFLLGQDHAASSAAGGPADSGLRRFEIGGQATDMGVGNCFGAAVHCGTPHYGLGAGATLNLSQHLAIDSTYNLLPTYDKFRTGFPPENPEGGRASEFLIGLRAEVRAKRYGLFVDAKPGFVSWSSVLTGFTYTPMGTGPNNYYVVTNYGRLTSFATEIGGGAEYSPSPRVHLRFDAGDLLVRFNDNLRFNYPTFSSACGARCIKWADNLQTTAGVYFSVGKPIAWTPPASDAEPSHRFLDRTNLALIGVSLLGQSADAITTQRFISHGLPEQDPLARPLVKYGWSGQIGLAALLNGGEISAMYWLHRKHQHRIERILPLPIAAASGVMAYRNDRTTSPSGK
jgi:hypothetical protein